MLIEISHFTQFQSTFTFRGHESPNEADEDGIIGSFYSIYYHRPRFQVKFAQD